MAMCPHKTRCWTKRPARLCTNIRTPGVWRMTEHPRSMPLVAPGPLFNRNPLQAIKCPPAHPRSRAICAQAATPITRPRQNPRSCPASHMLQTLGRNKRGPTVERLLQGMRWLTSRCPMQNPGSATLFANALIPEALYAGNSSLLWLTCDLVFVCMCVRACSRKL